MNALTYTIKLLSDMPAVGTGRGAKYSQIIDALLKEGQPGWGLFVDHANASDAELIKLATSLRTAMRRRHLKAATRVDFGERGVWIWLTEHIL